MTGSTAPPAVMIAVPTFKRPRELASLLESLAALRLDADAATVSVLVIDNNPAGDAVATVDAARARFPWRLLYVQETRPGVSHVRNRALELAATADFLAFVDDDEEVSPGWLATLLVEQRLTGAAAVMGPVIARYPEGAAPWMILGDFHSVRSMRRGSRSEPGYAGNCLLSMPALGENGLRFDAGVSLIGGEDTLFFVQLQALGYRIVNAPDAVVTEAVPPERARLGWLMRRWFRTGFTDAMVSTRMVSPLRARLIATVNGLGRLTAGVILTVCALPGGRKERVAMRLYTVARGAGMIAFALGRPYYEYGGQKTKGGSGTIG